MGIIDFIFFFDKVENVIKAGKMMSKKVELTSIQAKVLEMLLSGINMREISQTLNISYNRVINIANSILIKTRMQSRKELLINGKNIEYTVKEDKH